MVANLFLHNEIFFKLKFVCFDYVIHLVYFTSQKSYSHIRRIRKKTKADWNPTTNIRVIPYEPLDQCENDIFKVIEAFLHRIFFLMDKIVHIYFSLMSNSTNLYNIVISKNPIDITYFKSRN